MSPCLSCWHFVSLTLHSDLTGTATDVLTLHPKVGHEVSFFLFLLGHSSYLGAVFSTRGMQLFTFNCVELGEGDMGSPLGPLHWLSSAHAESSPAERGVE